MTTATHTLTLPTGAISTRLAPSPLERLLLVVAARMSRIALARRDRRVAGADAAVEVARAAADDRRRTAVALGTLGILPR